MKTPPLQGSASNINNKATSPQKLFLNPPPTKHDDRNFYVEQWGKHELDQGEWYEG
jgi:hypothetical protein